MKIGCLQFSPVLGDVDNNLTRADAVLAKANVQDLDLLVLPELAFSGYNFKSLHHISPYLEPTTSGISSLWARTTALKYECVVIVGYPEKVDISPKWPASPEYYNSAITVNKDGETISNYRKSFLYHTDSKWALEGPDGFFDGEIDGLGNVAIGICMDLNPYKFEAPWSAWEFAYHIIHKQANLVVLSMAWRTREDVRSYSRQPKEPDMDTLAYWLARLEPVIRAEQKGEIIVVFANRTGVEEDAVYTGTSAVLGICGGEVKVYGLLGRGEKELLVVDTSIRPKAKLVADPRPSSSEKANSETPKGSRTASPASATPNTKVKSKKSESKSPPRLDPKIRDKRDNPTNSSIDEILNTVTPISPVEPMSPHAYFSTLGKKKDKSAETPPTIKPPTKLDTSVSGSTFDRTPTPFPDPKTAPKTSIKSPAPIPTPVIPSNPSATASGRSLTPPISPSVPTPSKTSFRPVSPKSRNASRTRPIKEDSESLDSQEVAQDSNTLIASIIGLIEEKKLKPSLVVDQSKVPHTLSPTPNRRSLSPRPSSTVW
ncbi:hypothetical protein BCIN_12g00140 [Botrytis cinerea B05.10]|uniref:CN hydrolase domain-containing protein n=1 Tax=Botryotinia fuckeliana (strain B05.10) TaxID=332648 RepID=A0A384JXT1_BOTFB|nr:hypothetical protein BCIN_12g00140 [Botrytis cinerea B05.10]ATZ55416.1 hypothetical protein BCIN_12g00140 [Botrytis cinerea B05.10]